MDRRAVIGLFGGGLCTGGYGLLTGSTNNKLHEPVQLLLAGSGSAMVLVGLCIVGWLLVTAVLKDAARKKQRTGLRRQIGIAEGLRRRWSTEDSDELNRRDGEMGERRPRVP